MDWSKRGLGGVLVVLLVLVGFFSGAKPAWADPHAVFYTATAQAQLFFNVLAALNQADYVELAGDRKGLAGARGSSGSEINYQAAATETDLSNLISRPVTLEGYDQYSDSLLRQLAAEKQRIVSGEELAHVACERILGKPDCVDQPNGDEAIKAQEKATEKAFVEDPLEWAVWPVFYGAAPALFSGDPAVEATRRELLKFGNVPFAYSRDLHLLRDSLRNAGDAQSLALLADIDYLAGGIAADMLGYSDGNLIQGSVTPNYSAQKLRSIPELVRQSFVNENLPNAMQQIALGAAQRVRDQQALIQIEGSKGNSRVVSDRERDPGATLYRNARGLPADFTLPDSPGELSLELTAPPALRRSELDAVTGYSHDIDAAQQFANLASLSYHGDEDLTPNGIGEVLGIQSGAATEGGRVLAAASDQSTSQPTKLDVHQLPAHAQGFYGRLLALIFDSEPQRRAATLPTCGYSGCDNQSDNGPGNSGAPLDGAPPEPLDNP